MFVFKAVSILKAIKRYAPRLPSKSIDYAVMEKANNIYCVGGSYRWRDIGSFENIAGILKKESRKFVKRGGKSIKII